MPRKAFLHFRLFYYFSAAILILCIYTPYCQAALTPLQISEETTKEIEASPKQIWLKAFEKSREDFAKKYGTSFGFLIHFNQQVIIHSEQAEGKSRNLWYLYFEVEQKLWPGASVTAEFEVDRGKGVDKFLPTFSGFNTNSGDDASLYIPQLYFGQELFNNKVFLLAGKTDLSDYFDTNEVANSGDTQFLSDALINNETIPFPAKGIAAMLSFKPYDWMYFQSGAATQEAISTKIGLSDAFNSTLFLNELGFTPKFGKLQGNYRFILHLDHERLDFIDESDIKKNTFGFALSFDQAITDRITLFLRYGFADPKVRSIEYFWSAGGQITGLIPGRKYDCLGLGIAQSIMGHDYREYNDPDSAATETMYELYYNYNLNNIITLTPNLQVVINPDANKTTGYDMVIGLRVLFSL